MKASRVKGLYAIGSAKWYDFVKIIWSRLFSEKAEKDFSTFLKKNLNNNTRILELGCGTAMNLEKIYSLGLNFRSYLGVDFSSDMLAIARKKFEGRAKVKFQRHNITNLENHKGDYDVIICTWVLSHLDNPSDFVNKVQSLLSKDGKMFLIFFSKPKWFIDFWLYPLSKYLFSAKLVPDEEVEKINNRIKTKSFAFGVTTYILIADSR